MASFTPQTTGTHGSDPEWMRQLRRDPLAYARLAEELAAPARAARSLPDCRWLQSNERGGETVALVSYPRSGNSMLRGLMERAYGTYTGSDTRVDRTLSRALRDQWGMTGEGVTDPRLVHFVKTHWPERPGWRAFQAQRVVLLVRNPFDAIDSYFNMALTNTHHLSLADEVYERFGDVWQDMLRQEAVLWRRFHEWWLAQPVPTVVVRFEDLKQQPERTLRALVAWVEGVAPPPPVPEAPADGTATAGAVDTIEAGQEPTTAGAATATATGAAAAAAVPTAGGGATEAAGAATPLPLALEASVVRIVSEGEQSPYTPRVGGIGRALKRMSAELVDEVCTGAEPALSRFGYQAMRHGFDGRLDPLPAPQAWGARHAGAAVTINDRATGGEGLRDAHDRFGRLMTMFRKTHTADDTQPLPVVSGDPYRIDPATITRAPPRQTGPAAVAAAPRSSPG